MKLAACLLALALGLAPGSALAQRVSGPAVAVDGDTLDMTGVRVRLFGIDAVERGQTCARGGEAWGCGEEARALLAELVAGETVACEPRDTDAYGRMVAVCRAGRLDLSAVMAEAGLAVAMERYSDAYLAAAARARAQRAGIWAGEFVAPEDWRAANRGDSEPARVAARGEPEPVRAAATARREVYYRNCAAARAAGAAPIYRGQPGYRAPLDADGDGVACEPYRGR